MEEVADRLVDQGWDPDEARAEARRRFGDPSRYRAEMLRETDDEGGWMMETMASLAHDVRLAFRGLRKRPVFAWTLVVTLAMGIGAAGAIFSMVDAVLLRPLPYAQVDRTVDVKLSHPERPDFTLPMMAADQVEMWSGEADFLGTVALHERISLVRTGGAEPEQLGVMAVSPDLDDVLGVEALLGRTFAEDDGAPGARSAILTHPYWQASGGDPDIVGSTLRLDDETWTVVGVLPRGFKYPVAGHADVWIPLADDLTAAGRPLTQLSVVGLLADGLTREAAQERADVLGAALNESQPHAMGWAARLTPVDQWRGNPDTVRGLWTALGAVAGMLLIAVVNAANLQLVRGEDRQGELGVRSALGASRRRLVRHLMVESVVLALLAGVVATGLAWFAVEGLRVIAPTELTFSMVHEFGLEQRSLALVFVSAVVAGVVVGLLPVFHALRGRRATAPSVAAAGYRSEGRRAQRIRSVLVGAEVAVSVVLLVGAGLFLRSFAAIQRVDLGLDVERFAVGKVALPSTGYPTGADRAAYADDVAARLAGLPGVDAVTVSQGLPPEGGGLSFGLEPEPEGGEPRPTDELVLYNVARPGYFTALGTTFVDGRDLQPGDHETESVVIDRDLAQLVFGEDRVAGRRFRLDADDPWMTVVGVVEDLKLSGPDDHIGTATLVYPMDPASPPSYLTFAIRTDGDPAALLPAMRQTFLAVDDRLPLSELQTVEDMLADALVRPRFLTLLISLLAGVSLLLATVGLFGVVSYTVARGRRDMGIRMALGASGGRVRGRVLRWGAVVSVVGVVVGLGAAAVVDDVAESLLYGVAPGDPTTNLAVGVTMLGAALLACWWPAHRATKVDPVEVLRAE